MTVVVVVQLGRVNYATYTTNDNSKTVQYETIFRQNTSRVKPV